MPDVLVSDIWFLAYDTIKKNIIINFNCLDPILRFKTQWNRWYKSTSIIINVSWFTDMVFTEPNDKIC